MDALVDFLPLLFLAVYYLLGRKRKQLQRKRQTAPTAESGEPKGPTPFEEFVRQMEEAMREASGEPREEDQRQPEPTPATSAPPSPMPVPTRRPLPTLGGRREPEFREMGSFESEATFERHRRPAHEAHGYGIDQPFSEERFERMPRGLDETAHAHAPLAPRIRPTPSRVSYWRNRLKDPKQAQDALVLTEIFSGPWSPRKPKRR